MFSRPRQWISSTRHLCVIFRQQSYIHRFYASQVNPTKLKNLPVEDAVRQLESEAARLLRVVKKKVDQRAEALKKVGKSFI